MKALSLESGSATLRSSQFWLAGVRTALAIGVATSIPATTHADENGVSFWLPGLFGSLAAVPQQPGWALTVINYYDSVGASGAVAASREITIGRFSPTVNVNLNVICKQMLMQGLLIPATFSRRRSLAVSWLWVLWALWKPTIRHSTAH